MTDINDAGLALIKRFEGFRPTWYRDPGKGIWTIGYGHTDMAGYPHHADDPALRITERDGEIILKRDLGRFEYHIDSMVDAPLNENQFSALVSFIYNVGPGNFESSTMLRKLNAHDYDGAADEFKRWVHAGGKVLPGLVKRREEERALFLAPVKAQKKTQSLWDWLAGIFRR